MTFDVSKLYKFNEVKELHLINIYSILVTKDVSKLVIFKNTNELQLLNI